MGNIVGGITNALFGKGGAGTMGEAVARAKELGQGARFNPYTVRTSAGSTAYDPTTGTYQTTLSGPLQSILTQATTGAGSLFGKLTEFDPEARAADIFTQQAELLTPQFEQQAVALQNRLLGTGRLGLRLSGESQGLGAGGGGVQPDALGLGRQQQQTLAQLAPMARQQAYGEQASLQQLATGMLGAGLQLSQVENNLMSLGLTAEQARAAASLGAANMELAPYTAKANIEQQQRGQNAEFIGGLTSSLFGKGGFFNAG